MSMLLQLHISRAKSPNGAPNGPLFLLNLGTYPNPTEGQDAVVQDVDCACLVPATGMRS